MNQLRSKMVQQLVRNESTEIDIFRFPIKIWIHSLSVINFRTKKTHLWPCQPPVSYIRLGSVYGVESVLTMGKILRPYESLHRGHNLVYVPQTDSISRRPWSTKGLHMASDYVHTHMLLLIFSP